jgi:hypothetical protein
MLIDKKTIYTVTKTRHNFLNVKNSGIDAVVAPICVLKIQKKKKEKKTGISADKTTTI